MKVMIRGGRGVSVGRKVVEVTATVGEFKFTRIYVIEDI